MLGSWAKGDMSALAAQYAAGDPFPHLIIDGFLEEGFADQLLSEFPSIDSMGRTKDYLFGDKREEADFAKAGPACKEYYDFLMSDEFARIISEVTGGRKLFVDPAFHGGGFHQGGNGSFLDTHVDFNVHPKHSDWLRVLNILLYMNKDWPAEYDGCLLIRTDPKNEPKAVEPLFNRCVFMFTSDNTYHGYRKMSLPEGRTRKSIAGYAYELIDENSGIKARTTSWAPEEGSVVKKTLARHWTGLAAAKNKLTGN